MTSPPPEPATRSDGELLRRFLDTRDEAALSELVTRHAALVRGVCERWLGNTADADDAFQATFLVLVRRGERILRPKSLAAWLYGVAQRIARRLRSDRSRASAVVKEADAMIDFDPLAEMATQHDVALFDAELAKLPEKYRAPIVLHHLEGKSQREVAEELKLTEGAVDGLLKRGRSELRVRLARRGVVFGVTLAVLEKSHQALVAAPPEPLINATVQNILSFDPVLAPELPRTSSARLAQQEITTMSLYHAGKITAWTVAAGMLLGTAGLSISAGRHDLSLGAVALIASELDNPPAEPDARLALAGENAQELNPAAGNDLIDFVSVGEFDPATIGGFGGVLDAPGITVTTLETGTTTKVVIAGAFEKNDSTANTLRAVAITKDGKEIVPETRRAMAAGKGNQVVTLLCEFPIASTEIKRIRLQRKDRTESVTGRLSGDGTGTTSLSQDAPAKEQLLPFGSVISDGTATASSPESAPTKEKLRNNAKGDGQLEATFSNNTFSGNVVASNQIPGGGSVQFRRLRPTEERIYKALQQQTEIFVDSTLRDALSYIEDLHKFNILINEEEIADEGVDIEPAINIKLSGVELRTALDLMLEPHQLDYVIKNEVMMITTRSKAESPKYHELRIYNVDGLPSLIDKSQRDKDDATQKIENAIKQAVGGDWDGEGKEFGTLQWTPAGLVVRTNQRMHAEIEDFLQQLRRADGQTE